MSIVKRFVLSPSCVLNLQIANPEPENDIISATEVFFSTVKKRSILADSL